MATTKPPKRVFKNAAPDMIKAEKAYASALSPLAGAAIAATDALVLRRLASIIGDPGANQLKPGWEVDLDKALEKAYGRTWRQYAPRRLAESIRTARNRTERISKKNAAVEIRRQTKRSKRQGQVLTARAQTADLTDTSVQWDGQQIEGTVGNVERHQSRIKDRVTKGILLAAAVTAIAANAREVNGETRRAFTNMAATNTQTLNGRYAENIWDSAGVRRYRWITVGDDRVRDEHAAREGEIFEWSNPPSGGHPGEDWACRCEAQPLIADLRNVASTTSGLVAQELSFSRMERGFAEASASSFKAQELPQLERLLGQRIEQV